MKSQIFYKYGSNGNLLEKLHPPADIWDDGEERLFEGVDRLFAGNVGTSEFRIYFSKDVPTAAKWLPTDVVLIAFTRLDGEVGIGWSSSYSSAPTWRKLYPAA